MSSSSEIVHVRANGLTHACVVSGSVDGPLAVMVHGFPDTPHTWSLIAPSLVSAGFRVVAPYLRGYPPTDAPDDDDYSALALGADVLGLIDALGAKSAVVIGHDWGAFSAYAAASLAPEKIARLVILAIPHPRALSVTNLWKARHFVAYQRTKSAARHLRSSSFAGVDEIVTRWSPAFARDPTVLARETAHVKETFAQPRAIENALGYYASFPGDALSSRVRRVMLAKTRVPALAFFGLDDGALVLPSEEKLRACFTAGYDDVRLPGVGHFIQREAPDAVVARLLPFLAA